jgi:hypothetical protein
VQQQSYPAYCLSAIENHLVITHVLLVCWCFCSCYFTAMPIILLFASIDCIAVYLLPCCRYSCLLWFDSAGKLSSLLSDLLSIEGYIGLQPVSAIAWCVNGYPKIDWRFLCRLDWLSPLEAFGSIFEGCHCHYCLSTSSIVLLHSQNNLLRPGPLVWDWSTLSSFPSILPRSFFLFVFFFPFRPLSSQASFG